jgi:hypothetical protein
MVGRVIIITALAGEHEFKRLRETILHRSLWAVSPALSRSLME